MAFSGDPGSDPCFPNRRRLNPRDCVRLREYGDDGDDIVIVPYTTYQQKVKGSLKNFVEGSIAVSATSADTTSRAETSRARIRRASSVAGRKHNSVVMVCHPERRTERYLRSPQSKNIQNPTILCK